MKGGVMDPQRHTEPQLLSVTAAAELLSVDDRAILEWIHQERIPYVEIRDPGHDFAVPMHALLATIRRDDDLWDELSSTCPTVLAAARYWAGIASLRRRGCHLIGACIPGG
jgi:excisionase family DNA binding protein